MSQKIKVFGLFALGVALFIFSALFLLRVEAFTANAAAIDPAVYADLDASTDGQATYILYFREQADLSEAEHIDDWVERGRFVYERLRTTAARSQRAVQAKHALGVIPGQVTEFQPFWIANVVVVRGDREALDYLARQPHVARVLPEMKYDPPEPPVALDQPAGSVAATGVEWGVAQINAEAVWTAPYNSRGAGIVIGMIDTGVQWDHPALMAHYRGWDANAGRVDHNYNWFNPEPENTCDDAATGTCDWHGHGTHTTGTTVGGDGGDNQIGVAPDAKWIHALGCCPSNEAGLRTMQWMLAPTDLQGRNPDPALRPHVINNSWGGPGGSLIFQDIMAVLKAAGTMVVFSAGNSGSACGTLGSPSDNPAAFSVGATDRWNSVTGFSSRGPNPFSGKTGPEITAPGSQIRSSYPGSAYRLSSGTSMAAPHVTGAVALLLSVEPDLIGKVDQIEELLRRTAVPLVSSQTCDGVAGSEIPNNAYGWGRIDVAAAAGMIWQAGTYVGNIRDVETGLPVPGATIAV
ncbi:MAG TPA: S8 family serine peptidase, partial [Caldilineae bacterium]|nr:S8 family serine peptidase [Caldilineae bacterium]